MRKRSYEIYKRWVERKVIELGGKPSIRASDMKDGFTISDNGNLLINVTFSEVQNIEELNNKLKSICGVVETSLFTNVITKIIVASESGVKTISKN